MIDAVPAELVGLGLTASALIVAATGGIVRWGVTSTQRMLAEHTRIEEASFGAIKSAIEGLGIKVNTVEVRQSVAPPAQAIADLAVAVAQLTASIKHVEVAQNGLSIKIQRLEDHILKERER